MLVLASHNRRRRRVLDLVRRAVSHRGRAVRLADVAEQATAEGLEDLNEGNIARSLASLVGSNLLRVVGHSRANDGR